MRNLKRVLALAMAMVMILGMMVIGSSAASYTDSAAIDEDYEVAVEVLSGMGVFRGTGSGFEPKTTLDRASASALIYRVITGDVDDNKVELYDYPSFSDTVEGAWYNGYVTYAANGKYIVGDGTGKFNPNAKVTGVQVLKIMLRAMGYGANGEFEGAAWSDNVLTVADDLDLLENVKGNDLNLPATRELVAQLLFDAIKAPTTNYTPAFGYNTPWGDETSIAVNVFKLTETEDQDKWGRPAYVYYGEFDGEKGINPKKDVVYATFKEEAVATYSVKVSECQIAKDMGLKKNVDFKADGIAKIDVYTNGEYTKKQIDVYEEKANLGAQGRLIEVYSDRVVVIDTWLAQVTDVTPEKVDKNGHVKTEAYTDLDVWFDFNDPIADTIPGNDYAKDEYLLVNYNVEHDFYEVVGTPETFTGAQSKNWTNADKRTIDGEDYMEAVNFNLDDSFLHNPADMIWFQDQFGNLIGAVAVSTISDYAVLKDIIWIQGRPGYAEATLVYMDGTEDVVTVSTIDGMAADDWYYDDVKTAIGDTSNGFGDISTDSSRNGMYLGYALYRVDSLKNGTVALEGFDGSDTYVWYADEASIDTTNLRISWVDVFDYGYGDDIFVTSKTEFLVREGNPVKGYTYETYTINTIPNYEWNSEIFFTGKYNESIGYFVADRVYVKNAVEEVEYGTHIYVPMNVEYGVLAGYDTFTWELDVYVDGVLKTIATGADDMAKLVANKGKLFHVDWFDEEELGEKGFVGGRYGFVADVHLVNEKMDGTCYANCDYLAHGAAVLDTAIICGGESYMTNENTVYVGAADLAGVSAAAKANKGIWVVYGMDVAARTRVAKTVYVGTKLSSSTVLAPDYTDENIASIVIDNAAKTVTVTLKVDETTCDFELVGVNANTIVNGKLGYNVFDENSTSVTVYAEDGCVDCTAIYTIKVVTSETHEHVKANAITKVWGAGKSIICAQNTTAYVSIEDAVVADLNVGEVVNLTVVPKNTTEWTIEYAIYTSTAEAEAGDADDYKPYTDGIPTADLENGNIVVLKITRTDGNKMTTDCDYGCKVDTMYVLYKVIK